MQKRYAILVVAAILAGAALCALPRAASSIITSNLQKQFPSASVSVGLISLKRGGIVSVGGIRIERKPLYAITIDRVDVHVLPGEIIRGVVSRVSIEGARVRMNTGAKNATFLPSLLSNSKGGKSLIAVRRLSCLSADVELISADVLAGASLACSIDLLSRYLESVDVRFHSLQVSDLKVLGARLLIPVSGQGELSADEVSYNKLAARNIQGRARMDGQSLIFEDVRSEMLKGSMVTQGSAGLEWPLTYRASCKFKDLDLAEFTRAFELREKVLLGGNLRGSLNIAGTGGRITHIAGDLTAGNAGGTLTITDKRFLEYIAQSTGSSVDIVMESFRNYHYNTGDVSVGLKDDNLTIEAALDGAAGKRSVAVVVHDIFMPRRNQ